MLAITPLKYSNSAKQLMFLLITCFIFNNFKSFMKHTQKFVSNNNQTIHLKHLSSICT